MLVDIYEVGGKTCAGVTTLDAARSLRMEHEDVLECVRKIRDSFNPDDFSALFTEGEFFDLSKGHEDEDAPKPMFAMNKDGFALLVMVMGCNDEINIPSILFCLKHFNIVEESIRTEQTMERIRDGILECDGNYDHVGKYISKLYNLDM